LEQMVITFALGPDANAESVKFLRQLAWASCV